MKKLSLVSAVVAALFIAGCSSTTPATSGADQATGGAGAQNIAELASQIQSQVNNVYFDFDKFSIRSDMQDVITTNASLFNKQGAESLKIVIEGNCDEWGSDEYNYALGLKRAKAAKDALVNQGIDEGRIEILSNGEGKPVCTDKDSECDAQNRRDEFKILR